MTDFYDKYVKYKKKYLQLQKQYGAGFEKNPKYINFYEYKIHDYPSDISFNSLVNSSGHELRFNIPSDTPSDDCGLIKTINSSLIQPDENMLRSCDIIHSQSEPSIKQNLDHLYDKVYQNCNPKSPAGSVDKYMDNLECAPSDEELDELFHSTDTINIATNSFKKIYNVKDNNTDQFIYKLKITNNTTKIILVGDLHGGFHTFYKSKY